MSSKHAKRLAFETYVVCNRIVCASVVRPIDCRNRVVQLQLQLRHEDLALICTFVATTNNKSSNELSIRLVRGEDVVSECSGRIWAKICGIYHHSTYLVVLSRRPSTHAGDELIVVEHRYMNLHFAKSGHVSTVQRDSVDSLGKRARFSFT